MTNAHEARRSGRALAVRAERFDADSRFDQGSVAPGQVVQALQLAAGQHGELRRVHSVASFSHFNRVLTLGCPAPATDAAFAAIESVHSRHAGSAHRILVNDHTVTDDLARRLLGRG